MNKKSIGALLLSASLLVAGTASTFAYFTDSTSSDQTITLGNVGVSFSHEDNWKLAGSGFDLDAFKRFDFLNLQVPGRPNDEINLGKDSVTHVAPGDVLYKKYTLKNTGNLDSKVKLSLTNIDVTDPDDAGKGLAKGHDNDKDKSSLPDLSWFNIKAYEVNVDGSRGKEVALGVYPGYVTLDAKTQQEVAVYVGVIVDNGMKNDGMNNILSFTLKADATQWNNPNWSESGH
ncbi:SipW-dependent-type signal peptide-containing protein [Clostridium sp. 'White wine YQ']|uniref:SipW-dependent-type signal peptide-containing protein n=1 Tax=Clostridium sp. 'White wine YQ' TaxID=3027474 RepID=UPI0023666A6C|nr:SipW-dependent-type signal peptide-containing protein [Clostridium sp. 'White wine YQ']MDD7792792.1 SipW-dependent-type signal peptide-containing protein [Clostridium sp. 'White wine YQ']